MEGKKGLRRVGVRAPARDQKGPSPPGVRRMVDGTPALGGRPPLGRADPTGALRLEPGHAAGIAGEVLGIGKHLAAGEHGQSLDVHVHTDGRSRRRCLWGAVSLDLPSQAHAPAPGPLRHGCLQHPPATGIENAAQLRGRLLGPGNGQAGQADVAVICHPKAAGGHPQASPGVTGLEVGEADLAPFACRQRDFDQASRPRASASSPDE